jgi:hypothetical protein
MEQFINIIDTYFDNYETYKIGNTTFECEYGELIFYKEEPNIITLYGIYVIPEYRQQGFCRSIIQYIINKSEDRFTYFIIESVLSKILYDYLERFTYKNKSFQNTFDGFVYKLKN